jgi:hypothetical protein
MLSAGGEKIWCVIPQLIIPIKNALNTKNPEIILATLRIIQHMCICGEFCINFSVKNLIKLKILKTLALLS